MPLEPAEQKPGPLCHSRCVTLASRLLKFYVSAPDPISPEENPAVKLNIAYDNWYSSQKLFDVLTALRVPQPERTSWENVQFQQTSQSRRNLVAPEKPAKSSKLYSMLLCVKME